MNKFSELNTLNPNRFDVAIKKAIANDPEMEFEYERNSLANWVARLVYQFRESSDLTQSELAERIDVPQSFISRLENPASRKEPSITTLAKVMDSFAYKVNDMGDFTVNLMYTQFDDDYDGSLITRYSRIGGLDKYTNISDAQNAGREYYAEHPEVAPKGSERHLCILDEFGRLVSYVTKTIEHDDIPF